MSDKTYLDEFLAQIGEGQENSSPAANLDEFLAQIEKTEAEPSEGLLKFYFKQIFPSSKNNPGQIRGGLGGSADILKLGAEAATYPLRYAGGILNYLADNARGGDYGIGETHEESGKGYNAYKLPDWIPGAGGMEVSPMGFVQEVLHDPFNAAGGAAGKAIGATKGMLSNFAKHYTEGAAQEITRAILDPDVEYDGGNITKAGLMNGVVGPAFSAAGKGLKAGMKKLGKKIEPDVSRAAIAKKAHKSNVKPESLEFALDPRNREILAAAHKSGVGSLASKAAETVDPFHSKKFFDEDLGIQYKGLANVKKPIDLTPERNRLLGLAEKERQRVGNENLDSDIHKYLSKTEEWGNTLLGEVPWEKNLTLRNPNIAPNLKTSDFIVLQDGQIIPNSYLSKSSGQALHSATEANNIKSDFQKLAKKAYDLKSDVIPEAAEQARRSAAFTRREVRNALEEIGDEKTLAAWDRVARRMAATHDFQKQFGLSNDIDLFEKRLGGQLRNFENMTPKQREALKELSESFGLNLYEQARNVSYAKDLAPHGLRPEDEWRLAGWDKWLTGKNPISIFGNAKQKLLGENPAAAVRNTNAKRSIADFISNASLPDIMPPVYERPALQDAPVRPSDTAKQNAKEEQAKLEKARRRGIEMAAALGYKPETKAFDDAVNNFTKTYMLGEEVPYNTVGTSRQKSGERRQ